MLLLAGLVGAIAPVYAEVRDAQWDVRGATDPARVEARAGSPADSSPRTLRPKTGAPASCTTEIARGAYPFRDLLVSWNVDSPAGTGFVVELRVQADDAWSPWMHLGDWGEGEFTPGLAQRVTTCAGGRVDVDYFRGERAFDAAQIRVNAFTRRTGAEVVLRRMRFCFSDRERAVPALEPLASRPLGTVLDVAPRSQHAEPAEIAARICSPTSVAMVLDYRGVSVPTRAIAERAFDPAHDIYGNWPRNVQTAYSFGVGGYLARFSDWSHVERVVAANTPIVVSIAVKGGELRGAPYTSTRGHLLVLIGFDAAGDCVALDPAAPDASSARRTYRRADLETTWMARGGTAYVLDGGV